MKKVIIILLLMCVISVIYFMMQDGNVNIKNDYAEDEKLVSSELYALCNKSGEFLIRERIDHNTYKVYLLSECDFDSKSGNYYELDKSTKIYYGKEALNKTYLLKLNKNASSIIKDCREGRAYTWQYYKGGDGNIYVPYPYVTHSYSVDAKIYYEDEIKIVGNSTGEAPKSIIYRSEKIVDSPEIEERTYAGSELATIHSRAKMMYDDYENLYKVSNQITENKYKEILDVGFQEIELKYNNRTITVFCLDSSDYEVEAVIEQNGDYYAVPRGVLDEWYVNTLFSTLDLFYVDSYSY